MPAAKINGTSIYYQDEGKRDGPVLILSHSIFFDQRMFDPLVELLGSDYRIIRYDHRAHGQSARSEMPIIDIETLTADANALIDILDAAPCYFLGNSMGCFVALQLAIHQPQLLKGALVLGGSGEKEYKREEFEPLVTEMAAQGTAPFIDTLTHIMFGDTIVADPARANVVKKWQQYMLELGPDAARCAWGVINRKGILDELRACQVPLLVLVGEEDHSNEIPRSQAIADAAPQSEMHVIEKAGHSLALEAPEAVAARVRAFIDRIEAESAG